jgi:hypothetical protein
VGSAGGLPPQAAKWSRSDRQARRVLSETLASTRAAISSGTEVLDRAVNCTRQAADLLCSIFDRGRLTFVRRLWRPICES